MMSGSGLLARTGREAMRISFQIGACGAVADVTVRGLDSEALLLRSDLYISRLHLGVALAGVTVANRTGRQRHDDLFDGSAVQFWQGVNDFLAQVEADRLPIGLEEDKPCRGV